MNKSETGLPEQFSQQKDNLSHIKMYFSKNKLQLFIVSFLITGCLQQQKPYFIIQDNRLEMDLQLISRLDFHIPEFGNITVTLTDSGWVSFEDPDSGVYPADMAQLSFFLGEFNSPQINRIIDLKDKELSDFALGEETAITVNLFDFEQYLGTITIGGFDNEHSVGGVSNFIRLNDEPSVLSVLAFPVSYFSRGFIAWRDKTILRIPRDSLKSVRYIQSNNDELYLLRNGLNDWESDGRKINYATYVRLENYFLVLNTTDYKIFADVKTDPEFSIINTLVNGTQYRLDFYKDPKNLSYTICTDFTAECLVQSFNYIEETLIRDKSRIFVPN